MAIIPKGREPANVKKRIDTLFPKLNEAYPDKVIVGLQRDHKKWDETAREISKQLGYENKNDFLTAYGYKIEKLEGGRPSGDHMAIIDELKKRYPNGSPFQKLPDLAEANPDLAPKFKTLSNKANELFGMTFAKYLISEGVLTKAPKEEKIILSAEEKAEQRINKYKLQIDEVIAELKKRYPDSSKAPGTLDQLKSENADLPIHNLTNWILIAFEEKAIAYFEREGIINHKNKQQAIVSKNIARAQDKKPLPQGALEFVGRNFVHTNLSPEQEDKIRDIVLKRGGNIQGAVGYKTDYLIAAGSGTVKYSKAEKLVSEGVQIQILSYFKFMQMVSEYDSSDNQLPEFVVEKDKLVKYTGTNSDVVLPNGVKSIGRSAFYNNDAITEITITEGVAVIEKGAFEKCANLKHVNLPKTLIKIEDRAFESCVNLEAIVIPDSVIEFGKAVFHACKQLKDVTLSKKLKTCGEQVFWECTSLEEIVLPCEMTSVPHMAFADCKKLKTISLSDKISEIEGGAFAGCASLSEINLPNKLRYLRGRAFADCTLLSKVQLPNKIKKIDYEAFFNCTTLKEVELSENLTKIEESCFEGCTSLSKIVMYDALKTIGECAFKDCVSLTEQSFVVISREG